MSQQQQAHQYFSSCVIQQGRIELEKRNKHPGAITNYREIVSSTDFLSQSRLSDATTLKEDGNYISIICDRVEQLLEGVRKRSNECDKVQLFTTPKR